MEERHKQASLVLLNGGLVTEELLKTTEQQQKRTGRRMTEVLMASGSRQAALTFLSS